MIDNTDDPALDADGLLAVAALSHDDIGAIDHALVMSCGIEWRKVARVVGLAMDECPDRFHAVPDVYYAERVKALAVRGTLEAKGNLSRMRFSEVRLAKHDFSIPGHVRFVDGYLDAVGRLLTTDAELVSFACVDAREGVGNASQYNEGGVLVVGWEAEFCAFADDFLRVDGRSRLGFYLVEYLCWFSYFTQGATCFRCDADATDSVSEVAYRMEWPDGSRVLVIGTRSKR